MRSKFGRLVVVILAIVIMFSVASTAFADGGYYYGKYKSGFTPSQTFNKITDKNLEDNNVSCRTGSYSGAPTQYRSYLTIDEDAISYVLADDGKSHGVNSEIRGTAGMRVAAVGASESNYKYIRGEFYLYGGNTARRITDWSNYWG